MVAAVGGCAGETKQEVTLTVATFGQFGYDDLYAEYQFQHPEIKIIPSRAEEGGPYHEDLVKKLEIGTGLSDVQAVEEGYLSDILARSTSFNDLAAIGPDVSAERWLSWKYEAGKSKDGKLIGYGTDSGPLAMCYREDLLQEAKVATDPASVRAMFATWDSYFAAGRQYVRNSGGKAWFDSAAQNFSAMVNQLETGYLDRDDKSTLEYNTAIKDSWDKVTAAVAQGQSAKLTAFADDGNKGLRESAFTTKVCPAWMLGVIRKEAGPDKAGKWAVIDAFPNGGGNWGGSYLTVPKQSAHPREAAALAAWLTAPEQQLRAFDASGNFPSQVKALDSPNLRGQTNPYFDSALVGEIFAAQARKIGKPQYKGPGDGRIQETVIGPALKAVEHGLSAKDGWQRVLDGVRMIVP